VRLRLFALALVFSALVAGNLAERFLGLTAKILDLVLRLIRIAHGVSAPSLFLWEWTEGRPKPESLRTLIALAVSQ
jgi:hypothetical protein